jgi:hypothetical protein
MTAPTNIMHVRFLSTDQNSTCGPPPATMRNRRMGTETHSAARSAHGLPRADPGEDLIRLRGLHGRCRNRCHAALCRYGKLSRHRRNSRSCSAAGAQDGAQPAIFAALHIPCYRAASGMRMKTPAVPSSPTVCKALCRRQSFRSHHAPRSQCPPRVRVARPPCHRRPTRRNAPL